MIQIPEKITPSYTSGNILSMNTKVQKALSRQTVLELNRGGACGRISEGQSRREAADVMRGPLRAPAGRAYEAPADPVCERPQMPAPMRLPQFVHPLRKGQKTALFGAGQGTGPVEVCFGWNQRDPRVDVDASAFMLDGSGRVPGDAWFVFYGQENSPDRSLRFHAQAGPADREKIEADLTRLDPGIRKIVFVLTINEAFENHLNFSMLSDAYIRVLDQRTRQELVSFKMEEYYSNVTSMTVGELYLHNGQWKFNPVGNGVNQDLAGQCRIYGVEIG